MTGPGAFATISSGVRWSRVQQGREIVWMLDGRVEGYAIKQGMAARGDEILGEAAVYIAHHLSHGLLVKQVGNGC